MPSPSARTRAPRCPTALPAARVPRLWRWDPAHGCWTASLSSCPCAVQASCMRCSRQAGQLHQLHLLPWHIACTHWQCGHAELGAQVAWHRHRVHHPAGLLDPGQALCRGAGPGCGQGGLCARCTAGAAAASAAGPARQGAQAACGAHGQERAGVPCLHCKAGHLTAQPTKVLWHQLPQSQAYGRTVSHSGAAAPDLTMLAARHQGRCVCRLWS